MNHKIYSPDSILQLIELENKHHLIGVQLSSVYFGMLVLFQLLSIIRELLLKCRDLFRSRRGKRAPAMLELQV